MKAVCIHQENSFDPEVGAIVELEDLYITRVWRDGVELSIEDENRPGYHKPASSILSLLKEGDKVEENYCHGMFRVVS